MRAFVALVCLALGAAPVVAAEIKPQSSNPASEEAIALARRLVDVTGRRQMTLKEEDHYTEQLLAGLNKTGRYRNEALAAEIARALVQERFAREIDLEVELFAATFTPEEMRATIGFAESPIGHSIRGKQIAAAEQLFSRRDELFEDVFAAFAARYAERTKAASYCKYHPVSETLEAWLNTKFSKVH